MRYSKPHLSCAGQLQLLQQRGLTIPDPARALLRHLLHVVSPDCGWTPRLAALLAQHPAVSRQAMGFDPGWQRQPLWQ